HANIFHIAFNMYALNVLGPELERHYGRVPFLALYILSGFAGVVLSFLLTEAPSLGASTSIFGLLAAQGIFVYRNQKLFGKRARAALTSIVNIAVINLLIGLAPGIDDWGHVGGLLGGLVFAGMAGPRYEVVEGEADYKLVNKTDIRSSLLGTLVVTAIFGALVFWRAR
ncbi:MAG TPA: rhomboid family intramembrane serine protease, partial [Terriglobales bacterium]|nr:rhomboid family intramembrane serine protease [Terriglobales bacterium]